MRFTLHRLSVLMGLAACSGSTDIALDTGLEGTARRGPIQPVCQAGQSCDAPLSTRFDLLRGTELVVSFRSDAQGHYRVLAAPGTYRVVPDASAPLLDPRGQQQKVAVGSSGMTQVDLSFDTGIR